MSKTFISHERRMQLRRVGRLCAKYRRSLGVTQREIAFELNVTLHNVSHFECGKNDSATILLWYVGRGMDIGRELKNGLPLE